MFAVDQFTNNNISSAQQSPYTFIENYTIPGPSFQVTIHCWHSNILPCHQLRHLFCDWRSGYSIKVSGYVLP